MDTKQGQGLVGVELEATQHELGQALSGPQFLLSSTAAVTRVHGSIQFRAPGNSGYPCGSGQSHAHELRDISDKAAHINAI